MNTDELISALRADSATHAQPLRVRWAFALVLAVLAAALAFLIGLGPRPDFPQAMTTLRFPFKFVVTLSLAVSVAPLVLRMGEPGSRPAWIALLVAPVLLAAAMVGEFFALPPDALNAAWMGNNALLCLASIPLIGLAPLVIFLALLRRAAPTRPMLAGAAAGLLSGGIAATFYAAHCADDSPMFVGTWYTLGILSLALLGALAGRIVLRW